MAKKSRSYSIPTLNTTGRNRKPIGSAEVFSVLADFRGLVLTEEVAKDIFYLMCSKRIFEPKPIEKYKPELDIIPLDEVYEIMDAYYIEKPKYMSPLERLKTLLIGHKKFGFCDFEKNQIIYISDIGMRLINSYKRYIHVKSSEKEKKEAFKDILIIYRNALARIVQEEMVFDNPNIQNNKVVLPFLFSVLKELHSLGGRDLIIVSMWPDNNVKACCNTILQLRQNKELYTEANCVEYMIKVLGIEREEFFNKEKTSESETISNVEKAWFDNWFKYLTLVEWVEITEDRRVILNLNEIESIDYVISAYSDLCSKYSSSLEYEKSLRLFDEKLAEKPTSMYTDLDRFKKQAEKWSFEEIIDELKRLNGDKTIERSSKIPVDVEDASVFEFITALALNKVLKTDSVIPNFAMSNAGMILSKGHAGGKKSDIVVENYDRNMLVEVTLLRNADDIMRKEYSPIISHLEDYNKKKEENKNEAFCLFIVPNIPDSFIRSLNGYNNNIKGMVLPITISDFIKLMLKYSKKSYSSAEIYTELSQQFLF